MLSYRCTYCGSKFKEEPERCKNCAANDFIEINSGVKELDKYPTTIAFTTPWGLLEESEIFETLKERPDLWAIVSRPKASLGFENHDFKVEEMKNMLFSYAEKKFGFEYTENNLSTLKM